MDPDDLFSVFDDGGSDASTQQSSSSRPATGNKRSASSSSVQSPAPAAKRPRVEQPTPITPKRQTTPAAVAPVASAAPSVDAPSTTSEMPPTSGASTVTAADAVESSSASTPSAPAASSASSSYLLGEGPIELGQEATERETEIIRDCIHEVAYPPDWQGERVEGRQLGMEVDILSANRKPAREYRFELDPFQKASVACLERGQSVLVSAHTSAGKTVVAEYAIAMSLRDKQRVIYTSPIKALSNQKYRELFEEFEDVGLMTGDVTINTTASCLVMTTEILRSMLYRGSEIMREVGWVIFDEIHYLRDKERGVVWEETIILLPDKVRYVFLSATVPNAKEFAEWIAKTHNQPCNVVYTDYRPTPLQHYIFPGGGDGLYLVVDEKGRFRESNFQRALSAIGPTGPANKPGKKAGGKGGKGGAANDCFKIVKMIMERNYQPVIVFSFSKRECEGMALQMSKLDFNSEEEKSLVEGVFNNAIDSLSDDDKKLPQVESILPLLKRGIGIHHSGLLPILKEVIEILFQEGLVKSLFATETFAMGLNMPAKTVVFTSVRKFDGQDFRWLNSGEYIQMSGRAGRRGLDARGIVILMVDEKMEPAVAKNMLKGAPDALISQFHLGYNMLLNLLRLEGVDPERLMKRSFHQFQSDRALPAYRKQLAALQEQIDATKISDEELVSEYYFLNAQLEKLRQTLRDTVNQPIHSLQYLQPGRLARVKDGTQDWGWGVIVNFQKKLGAKSQSGAEASDYVVDMLLDCVKGPNGKPQPVSSNPLAEVEMQVIPVLLPLLDGMSSVRIFVPKDLRPFDNRRSVSKALREVMKRFPTGLPLLDPIEDMRIEEPAFKKLIRKIEALEERLESKDAFRSATIKQECALYEQKLELQKQAKAIKKNLRDTDQVILKEELKAMKKVLRRLGFVNREGVVEMKGRVACEINSADELVLTEMIFNGVFNDLAPEQIVALASCFVFQEKCETANKLKEELAAPLRQMQDTARRIGKLSLDCKLSINVEEYVGEFKPNMMDVVYAWSKGAKFIEICKMTDIFEGSVIRCMRRLEELLRQLCAAAKAIGNSELELKFSEAIARIKRDIVFAASLYL